MKQEHVRIISADKHAWYKKNEIIDVKTEDENFYYTGIKECGGKAIRKIDCKNVSAFWGEHLERYKYIVLDKLFDEFNRVYSSNSDAETILLKSVCLELLSLVNTSYHNIPSINDFIRLISSLEKKGKRSDGDNK